VENSATTKLQRKITLVRLGLDPLEILEDLLRVSNFARSNNQSITAMVHSAESLEVAEEVEEVCLLRLAMLPSEIPLGPRCFTLLLAPLIQ
jgi:hypothetical protein